MCKEIRTNIKTTRVNKATEAPDGGRAEYISLRELLFSISAFRTLRRNLLRSIHAPPQINAQARAASKSNGV
jgi:hypothetical protein